MTVYLEVLAHWACLLPECVGFEQEPYPDQVAVEVLTPLNERDARSPRPNNVRHYGPKRLVRHSLALRTANSAAR
jgi:hypothetical protein